jgi:antitoxin ParD1/3/4
MSVKTSISLTESQEAYARDMVKRGRYPSLSAVLQSGLELLRSETEFADAELAGLRGLLAERRAGNFIDVEEGRERTRGMIAIKANSDAL